MMMCGGNKKWSLSVRNGGNLHTHTHTHTPISVAEKNFILNCREAMNENSWAFFVCGKKAFWGDRVVSTLSYAIKV